MSESDLPKNKIYVDDETFKKFNFYAPDFKSPSTFLKHLLKLYEGVYHR